MLGTFLTFLVCAISQCDVKFDLPEITATRNSRQILAQPFVRTRHGDMEGYFMTSMSGRRFFAFEGIRYAVPPVGENRFREPIPSPSWNGVFQAKNPGPACLQMTIVKMLTVTGKEDCLFLSVYTPKLPDGTYHSKLPVILYIHGGAFHQGAGKEQGPTYILDKDVVLVNINYRLGILGNIRDLKNLEFWEGFLSTGDEVNPGNWGLKDQALALKWTYENIDSFGGDPEKITIMGQSAGGASVHFHLMSEQSKKYIRSAVSISGTAFNYWALNSPKTVRRYNEKLANLLDCSSANSKIFMNCIRNVNPEWLVASQLRFHEEFYTPSCLFTPVVEPDLPGAFLVETPTEAYLRNNVANVPWINTITSEEGHAALLIAQSFFQLGSLRKRFKEIIPTYFGYKYEIRNISATTEAIAEFYTGSPIVENVDIDQLSQMFTDRYFSYGTHHSLIAHSRIAPTYAYYFSYKGVHNLANIIGMSSEEWGVNHAEDLFYYFNSTYYIDAFKQSDPDYKISKLMINLLYNFVAISEPYYTSESGINYKIWDSIDSSSTELKYLQIDEETKMISEPFLNRVNFWQNLGLLDTQKWYYE